MLRRISAILIAITGVVAQPSAVAQQYPRIESLPAVKKAIFTTSLYEHGFPHKIIACINADHLLSQRLSKTNLKASDWETESGFHIAPEMKKAIALNKILEEKDSKLKISEIRVDGGMVKNNSFLQSLANVSQIKIIRPNNVETTSLGAAYLAAIQSGYLNSTSQINKLWKKNKIVKANISKSISKSNVRKWKLIINTVNNFY